MTTFSSIFFAHFSQNFGLILKIKMDMLLKVALDVGVMLISAWGGAYDLF